MQGWFAQYVDPLLPLAKEHPDATGAAFALNGKLESAELYATAGLFQQMWPKILWSMSIEALLSQPKSASEAWQGGLPSKGEVTAWLAGAHGRRAARHNETVNERTRRRIRSANGLLCFETLDIAQDGLCVHEFILAND